MAPSLAALSTFMRPRLGMSRRARALRELFARVGAGAFVIDQESAESGHRQLVTERFAEEGAVATEVGTVEEEGQAGA
jgi:hypothetical protein